MRAQAVTIPPDDTPVALEWQVHTRNVKHVGHVYDNVAID